jgi:hypothetical protein
LEWPSIREALREIDAIKKEQRGKGLRQGSRQGKKHPAQRKDAATPKEPQMSGELDDDVAFPFDDMSTVDTRTDTRGREQPSTKPAKAKPAKAQQAETGEKVLTLSSRINDLVLKWSNEGKTDGWFKVDDWEFSIRCAKSPVNRAAQTGQAYRAKGSPKIQEGTQTAKWSPKNDGG